MAHKSMVGEHTHESDNIKAGPTGQSLLKWRWGWRSHWIVALSVNVLFYMNILPVVLLKTKGKYDEILIISHSR